jgi:hypothetical protein
MFDLETAILIDQYLKSSIVYENLQREAMVTRIHYRLARLDDQISALRFERKQLDVPGHSTLTEEEMARIKLVLIRKEAELNKMKTEAVKERDSLRGGKSIG